MGVEWTPGKLVYTLDGRPWATVRSRHVPAEPMEFDMQSQAGTCGVAYAPCPDASTPAHVDLQVDWVAAYARRPPA
jgi:beta-glucanase (GH16 family)